MACQIISTSHRPLLNAVSVLVAMIATLAIVPARQAIAQETETNSNERPMRRQYMLAEGLFDRQFYDLAETEFRKFIDEFPASPLALRAHYRLAECFNAQDQLDSALATIEKVEETWPDAPLTQRLLLLKANIHNRTGDTDKAIETYRRLIGNPDSRLQETARYFLARLLETSGQQEVAQTLYRTLAEKDIDDQHQYRGYAVFSLAAATQQQGELDKANELYAKLFKAENAPRKLREEALYRYAENEFVQGRYQSALTLYDRILVDYSNGDFFEEALKRRIWCHYSLGDYEKAIEMGQEWHRQHDDSDDFEMNFVMGASLVGASLFDQAVEWLARVENGIQVPNDFLRIAGYQRIYCHLREEDYQTVLELAPKFVNRHSESDEAVDVHYFWGTAFYRTGNYAEAVQKLEKALELFVEQWDYEKDARLLLARCLEDLGQHSKAANVLNQLANMADSEQQGSLRLRAGDAARKAEDWDTAIESYRNALLSKGLTTAETRTAIGRLAQIYTQNNQLDEAIQTFEAMLPEATAENQPHIQLLLGYLYIEQKQLDKAEGTLKQLIRKNGIPPEIAGEARYFLADTLLQKGETDEAMSIFSELLSRPSSERPDFSNALLLQLQELFFNRAEYTVSEKICRWLLDDSEPSIRNQAAVRLAEILIATKRHDDAEKILQPLLKSSAVEDSTTATDIVNATIMMGDIHLYKGELDRAATAFQSALSKPGLSPRYATKARLALAQLLKKEGRLNQSLRHAVNAFVLGNDPIYTPQAMLLAIELLVETDKIQEARTTWKELQARFPVFAQKNKNNSTITQLETPNP